jgi:hypothetical protein
MSIGTDAESDAARYTVSANGVVVIGKREPLGDRLGS